MKNRGPIIEKQGSLEFGVVNSNRMTHSSSSWCLAADEETGQLVLLFRVGDHYLISNSNPTRHKVGEWTVTT